MAVAPDARRQRIGTAVTSAPLALARELGYRIGILQASEMGARIYRKLGFKDCGQFRLYGWGHADLEEVPHL